MSTSQRSETMSGYDPRFLENSGRPRVLEDLGKNALK